MDSLDLANYIVTMVLSLVALTVTIIGFFASLRFYRDGSELQNQSREALAAISAKVESIGTQVGGMFDRTLSAALGRATPGEVSQGPPLGTGSRERELAGTGEAEATREVRELQAKVDQFWTFRGYRLSNVATGFPNILYNFGSVQGFNLLDNNSHFIFFGFFFTRRPEEIIIRTRVLLDNLVQANSRVREAPPTTERDQVLDFFAKLEIYLLIPDHADSGRVVAAVAEHQNPEFPVRIHALRPSDVESFLEQKLSDSGYD